MASGKTTLDPTRGIEDVMKFGDKINLVELKEHFGEVTDVDSPGLDSDGNSIKIYNFASGLGLLAANDTIVQVYINNDSIKLNSGIKVGSELEDIREEYGDFFVATGDPKYGTGMIIYNLFPNHIIAFSIDIEGICYGIMAADCNLIYKISPSSEILKFWDAPFEIEETQANNTKTLKIINDDSFLDGNYMTIKGEVLNNSAEEKKYVQVTANLYDLSGQIVDTVSSYVESTHLKPGSVSQFTIVSEKGSLAKTYKLTIKCQ